MRQSLRGHDVHALARSITVRANMRRFRTENPRTGETVSFEPKGRLLLVGDTSRLEPSPNGGSSRTVPVAVRMFIDLSVRRKSQWKIEQVARAVRAWLRSRDKPEGSCFLAQAGVYTSDASHGVVQERSVQIVVLNLGGWTSNPAFFADMRELADCLVEKFRQETVYVDEQEGGVAKRTSVMVSGPARRTPNLGRHQIGADARGSIGRRRHDARA